MRIAVVKLKFNGGGSICYDTSTTEHDVDKEVFTSQEEFNEFHSKIRSEHGMEVRITPRGLNLVETKKFKDHLSFTASSVAYYPVSKSMQLGITGAFVDMPISEKLGMPLIPTNCASISFENHSYLICKGHLRYPQSVEECKRYGMYLSHIDSVVENKFVVDLALSAFGCSSHEETSYWISNLKSEIPNLSLWAKGEPNGDANDNNIHLIRFCDQPYGWNDVPPILEIGWVCER